ncbi:MAG: ATP-binding cassette domain-containing protein [Bacillota bacterium]
MNIAFKVRNLSYRYPKTDKDVVNLASFDIYEGEIFGLLGPSGAGKSTTQKILIKLLDNFKGDIEYFGKDFAKLGVDYYEEIGVGFEMPVHFSKLTGMENVKFFLNLYKNQADPEKILKSVGLWQDRDKKVSDYSKGMKVRLNFVRAIINNPRVLFLDEITNGLDPVNAKIIKDIIIDFSKKGGTVFITTHLMADVEELCDRVVFMVDGKVSEAATPRELKLKYGKKIVDVEYKEQKELKKQTFTLENLGENKEFLETIKTKEIETIHSGETSLADIFIKVTGVNFHEKDVQ